MRDIVLIIGASSDIGLDLISNLTEECLILAHYHTSKEVLLALREKSTNEIILLQADLAKEEELELMLNIIEKEYGSPTKIVHLAAPKVKNIRFKDIQWNDFEQDINVSFKSAVLILQRFLPKMAKQKKGKVVIMLSSYVLGLPPKALSNYVTVKYALLGLVKALSSEYAEKNININAISPSLIETKFLDNLDEKIIALAAHNHPLKRNAQTNDIVPIIKLLLSSDSDYMCGVNIPVTGGIDL